MSAKVGRNDPCPCGSGRKYKRCCLGADEASAAATEAKATFFANTDLQILSEIRMRCPDAYEAAMGWEDSYTFPPDQFLPFWMPLITWESEGAEGLAAGTVAPSMQGRLSSEQWRYVEAQLDSWFSIWRALDVTPGVGCRVVDELTGVERSVRERTATQMLKVGDAMLVRVVREGVSWGLHGTYPRTLPRAEVADIVEYVRFNLDLGDLPVDPERLRGEAAFEMANLVNEAIVSLEFDGLPEVVDAEGNPLRIVEDAYEFDADSHPALVAGLEALDGAQREDPVEDEDDIDCERWVLTRRREDGDPGVFASLQVGGSWMSLEALSLERADEARAMIEEASGVRLLLGSRESRSPADILAAANEEGVRPLEQSHDPETDAMLRQVQEQHYARWRDESIPALGGLTPRQAAAKPGTEVHATLLEILTSIEELESSRPPGQRFDYTGLRESLGLS